MVKVIGLDLVPIAPLGEKARRSARPMRVDV